MYPSNHAPNPCKWKCEWNWNWHWFFRNAYLSYHIRYSGWVSLLLYHYGRFIIARLTFWNGEAFSNHEWIKWKYRTTTRTNVCKFAMHRLTNFQRIGLQTNHKPSVIWLQTVYYIYRFNLLIASSTQPTIAFSTLSLLLELPVDYLEQMVLNIVICGGGSEVEGVISAIRESIKQTCFQNAKFSRLRNVIEKSLRISNGSRLMIWRGYFIFRESKLLSKQYSIEDWRTVGRWSFP